ncbi:MAG TPA: tachylectin-related carbohydrate-binding protein, partial [Thermoanaerobaculia bacterium]|nr:tachylectin-related carbohydrate-binding protein [Thermoanaerobaculia bacterium]
MRAIFISYRREDAEGQAGRLFDDLAVNFGDDSVFMDVAGLEPGRDFRRAIDEQVTSCGVLLAVIGKGWLDATGESGQRRLDDPMDFVRLETASALKRDIPVIPVLVRGASMPRVEDLPEDLKELAFRNGVELTHARWDSDMQVLVKALRPYVQTKAEPAGLRPPSPAPGKRGPAWRGSSLIITAVLVSVLVIVSGGFLWHKSSGEPVPKPLPKPAPIVDKQLLAVADNKKANAELNRINNETNATPDTHTFPPPRPRVRPVFIYAVNPDGRLVWWRHDGAERGDGLSTPGAWVGSRFVGRGWEGMTTVFGGGGNSIYGIDGDGLLKWYQHNGFNTGDASAWIGPKDVGRGWGGLQHVFPGGNGIIYTISDDGILRWYKHNGFLSGAGVQTPGAWEGPKDVGRGWGGLKHVFSGGDGIIYTISDDGILRWYKHNGFLTGAGLQNPGAWEGPKDVGRGWGGLKHVFSG